MPEMPLSSGAKTRLLVYPVVLAIIGTLVALLLPSVGSRGNCAPQ